MDRKATQGRPVATFKKLIGRVSGQCQKGSGDGQLLNKLVDLEEKLPSEDDSTNDDPKPEEDQDK